MESLIHFVISPSGVLYAVSAILLVSLSFMVTFYLRINPLFRGMTQANRKLAELEGEDGFAHGFEGFNEWIQTSKTLQYPWGEFKETLLLIPDEKIKNTHDSEYFFNESSLVRPYLNLRFYNNLPNLITGVGILGTFIGLVCGIHVSSNGINNDDIRVAKAALGSLLNGASLAFATSIAGLGSALFFSWFEKHHLNKLHNLIQRWNDALNERLERLTPEKLAFEGLKEAKEQSNQLRTFNTDLAFSIAEALDERIAGRLGQGIDKLITAVEGMREDRDRTNESILQELVDKFSQSISGAAGQEMEALAGTLTTLNQNMESHISTMAESQEKMRASTESVIDQASEVLQTRTETMQQSMLDATDQVVGRISKSVEEMASQMRHSSSEAAVELGEAAKGFGEGVARLGETLDRTEQTTRNMSETAVQFTHILQATRSSQDFFENLMNKMGNYSAPLPAGCSVQGWIAVTQTA